MSQFSLSKIIAYASNLGASDVHISPGIAPRVRVDGRLIESEGFFPIGADISLAMAKDIAGDKFDTADRLGEFDAARTFSGKRCRINLFRQRGTWSAAIRLLSDVIPKPSELGLPDTLAAVSGYSGGLVLVTGETGSGKSTTLASIVNEINKNRNVHILTLEDPIEYIYEQGKSLISQREVGLDTGGFAAGLRSALREDPDVILVGEMRDLETISTAITAAETGHLVLSTVHSNSAMESVDRLVDAFPEGKQKQIRLQLSTCLTAVFSQMLLPMTPKSGRVLACEVMRVNTAIRTLIREGKTQQIAAAIENSGNIGNILMRKALDILRFEGKITESTYNKVVMNDGVSLL